MLALDGNCIKVLFTSQRPSGTYSRLRTGGTSVLHQLHLQDLDSGKDFAFSLGDVQCSTSVDASYPSIRTCFHGQTTWNASVAIGLHSKDMLTLGSSLDDADLSNNHPQIIDAGIHTRNRSGVMYGVSCGWHVLASIWPHHFTLAALH